jgi:hypothetical protein
MSYQCENSGPCRGCSDCQTPKEILRPKDKSKPPTTPGWYGVVWSDGAKEYAEVLERDGRLRVSRDGVLRELSNVAEWDENVDDVFAERNWLRELVGLGDLNPDDAEETSAAAERSEPAPGGVAAFFGTWPGDETDEELQAQLNEVRGKTPARPKLDERVETTLERLRRRLRSEPGAAERLAAVLDDICECGGSIRHNEHADDCAGVYRPTGLAVDQRRPFGEGLPVFVLNGLHDASITNDEQLAALCPRDILRMRKMGSRAVDYVQHYLLHRGMSLAPDSPKPPRPTRHLPPVIGGTPDTRDPDVDSDWPLPDSRMWWENDAGVWKIHLPGGLQLERQELERARGVCDARNRAAQRTARNQHGR